MSIGGAVGADLAACAGATFAVCVAALVVGVAAAAAAAAALGGAAAGLAGGVAAFVGAGEEDDFVSTLLPIAGVAATEGAVFVAVGGMAGAGGAALGNRAALGCGAFLSVTTAGAVSGPAQPEIKIANNVAVRPGTIVENIFVQYISSPLSIRQFHRNIIGVNMCRESEETNWMVPQLPANRQIQRLTNSESPPLIVDSKFSGVLCNEGMRPIPWPARA